MFNIIYGANMVKVDNKHKHKVQMRRMVCQQDYRKTIGLIFMKLGERV